jgi:ATP-binding cassette subfamily B protein
VVSGFSGGYMYFVLTRIGEGVVLSSRKHLSERLLRLPIKEYDLRRTGDLVSRVSADTTLLRNVMTQGLIDAIGGVVIFVGSVVAMAIIDPILLACTLGVLLIAMASIVVVARRVRAATTKAQERVGAMSAAVERALSAVRTIRAARAEKREADEITKDAQQAYEQGVKIARINSAISPIAGIAMNGAFIIKASTHQCFILCIHGGNATHDEAHVRAGLKHCPNRSNNLLRENRCAYDFRKHGVKSGVALFRDEN